MATFRQEVESTLKALPPRHRAAFAGACAERLVPNYTAFHLLARYGDPSVLIRALDGLWAALELGGKADQAGIPALRQLVEAVVPPAGEYFVDFTTSAVEAAAATRAALFCLERGDVKDALEAARAAEDSVRLFLQDRAQGRPQQSGGELPPLLAEEHRAQRWTLQRLLATDVVDRALIRALREAFRGKSNLGIVLRPG